MKDPDDVLLALFEEECRSRSEDPLPDLRVRRPRNPLWKPIGAVAAAALLLTSFTLGMQYRQPSELDRLIARSLPEEESWNRILDAGSRFVVTALEGPEER